MVGSAALRKHPFSHSGNLRRCALAGVGALLLASAALAQQIRPSDERPDLPELEPKGAPPAPPVLLPPLPAFEPPGREPGGGLPRLILPGDVPGPEAFRAGARVPVREVRIRGNTALSDAALAAIARPYEARALDYAQVQALRDALTLAYIDAGYVTSGAVIPEQDWSDGVLDVEIVEGRLAAIEIETDGRLRASYLERQVDPGPGPLDVNALRERLQVLQQDDRIRAVRAELVPGARLGESVLRVAVEEARAWDLELGANNYVTPSLGDVQGAVRVAHRNLTGFADVLSAEYEVAEGLHDVRPTYQIPFTRWDTRLGLTARWTWSEIVEDPFDDLDIESETQSYAISLHQPLLHTPSSLVEAFGIGEYRRSDSFLSGDRFSFVAGTERGVAKLAVLRGGLAWTYRSPAQVLALRGTLTGGLDALGATHHAGRRIPDGQFVAGLLQAQWARRLPFANAYTILRANLQLADRPLLGLEQFSIGGRFSVRGYRENEVVRDSGADGSLELHVPIPLPGLGNWHPGLELVPFVDAGYAWNQSRQPFPRGEDEDLFGTGIGAQIDLTSRLAFEVFWGASLADLDSIGEDSLQDHGVHLGLRWVQ
jgi:hemolysin activation/secretion protein